VTDDVPAPPDEGPGLGLIEPQPAESGSEKTPYKVLARKYRPQDFSELIGQDALAGCGPRESGRLGQLAELGFAFSLDKIATLNLDLVDLRAKSVRFVKITAGLLTTALRRAREEDDGQEAFAFTEANDIHAEDFKELLTRYGIDLIAEKIETEAEVVEVLDMQVDYGQGHLFGEPRPVVLSAGGAGLASTQTIGERMQAVARR